MRNFDRVVCISLARRQDRREAFLSRVPGDFPFGEIEIFDAIDGKVCNHPKWWRQGGGAWGCYRSHLAIIEQSLMAGHESVLIFEDDATFCEGFAGKAIEYFEQLPETWEQAYVGGQHLRRPKEFGHGYVRCLNVNRTHGYALQKQGLIKMYSWLNQTEGWHPRNHIDHHMGRLHGSRGIEVFAPNLWLCGQAADDRSDVCWKPVSERWWLMKQPDVPCEQKFVAVIGLHRSGSSATAMILHKLGVSMGDQLTGYEGNHGGGGEAVGLQHICERYARFPATEMLAPESARGQLKQWIEGRMRRHAVSGGKYPHLCAMIPAIREAAGDRLRVVHCDRPLEDSIESLKRRSRKCKGWLAVSDEQCEAVQQWLWEEKTKQLSRLPGKNILDVDFDRLMNETESVVDEIIDFLGLSPTEEQRLDAVNHIRGDIKK